MGKETIELQEPRNALHGQLIAISATSRDITANVVVSVATVEHGAIEITLQDFAKRGKTTVIVRQTEHSRQRMKICALTSWQPLIGINRQ